MPPTPRSDRGPAQYARIARELTELVGSGRIGIGQRFPSEAELTARYGVSRHTAREALRLVEEAGLIERRKGSGSYVRAHKPPAAFRHAVQTVDDLLQYGMTARLVIETSERIRVDAELARRLEVPRGTSIVVLHGVRYGDATAEPVGLMDAYVLPRRGLDLEPLLDPLEAAHSLRALVDVRRLSRVEQTFSASLLTAADCARLGGQPGDAAMMAERRYFDEDARLLALAVSMHRADRFRYTSVLTRESL
jgi:DNA-binding GntR family transcriptional regulator